MRFFCFQTPAGEGIGLQENGVHKGLGPNAASFPGALHALLQQYGEVPAVAVTALHDAPILDVETLHWLPPIPRPGKILCTGLNYIDHAEESGITEPQAHPTFFLRVATSLVAHRQPLVQPKVSAKLDYEAEMAVIIGRTARHVSKADALAHVAGYSCFNDASVRDYQDRTSQWTEGKNFDATGGFGPYLVPSAVLPAGGATLDIALHLNGKTMQSSSTAKLIFDVATLIHLASQVMTLEPGDVLITGTPAGVGDSMVPPVYLMPGDNCVVAIERLGELVNPVIEE
jgi:acylpyruvate hydrolase